MQHLVVFDGVSGDSGSTAALCPDGEPILFSGLGTGLNLGYGCATGTCGGCRGTLVSGRVNTLWSEAPGRKVLRKAQEILLCQSTPISDCHIRAPFGQNTYPRAVPVNFSAIVESVVTDGDGLAWVNLISGTPINFLPGQFFLISVPSVVGFRAYSPAQSGQTSRALSLLIRKKEGGGLSPLLCSEDAIGKTLKLFGPLGFAHARPTDDGDLTIVAGGSGAAVAISILEWAAVDTSRLDRHVEVVCGLRSDTPKLLINRFLKIKNQLLDRMRLVFAFSDNGSTRMFGEGIEVENGLVHEVAQRKLALSSLGEKAVFVAGPEVMVNATLRMLISSAKMSPTQIRFDNFS